MKKIILTGDRPTGKLHLGHYIGSIKSRIELQNSGKYDEFYIMIADAQALTDNAGNVQKVRENILEVALDYLSCGLDPQKACIFIQSEIPALSEISFYYMNLVTLSRLKRNPTVKEEIKLRGFEESVPVGFLTYTPTEIISVKNYSMEITYNQNQYTLSGNKISFPYNNGLPYLQEQWLDGKNIPSQYNDGSIIEVTYNDNGGTNGGKHVVCENAMTRTNFLVVTYKYNHTEQPLGFNTPTYSPQNFPNLLKKLNNAEPIKILVFGDSISVGASASSMMGFAPYTPTWFDQIKKFLANRYYGGDSSKITLVNASRGGVSSSWGVEQIENNKFDKTNYDLVFIGYGMNDGSLSHNATMFKNNISSIK